jgi:hypothetical protein
MVKNRMVVDSGVRWRMLLIAAFAGLATLWSSAAMATITQGDFSVFGFFETRESGRWGEGGSKDGSSVPATYLRVAPGPGFNGLQITPGRAATESGGSFDFNHWDLVQARQLADIRPDYHMVKNYKFLGRLDTMVLKDADFFAFYRPWYDAFGTIKERGRAEPNRDWPEYSQSDATGTVPSLQQEYFRNDLREYYAQLNFTDNFSMRVGKQQIIWSEADALSGTELTNPSDLRYHWTHFETPENIRKNLRMVKFNYILPDFLKTANNEAEAVWIPGDYQGDATIVNVTDARNPWIFYGALTPGTSYNTFGQPFRHQTFADQGPDESSILAPGLLAQEPAYVRSHFPTNALDNSEFAFRYSSLLPIGNGLQASFIYLYEARDSRLGLCTACPAEFGTIKGPVSSALLGVPLIPAGVRVREKGVFEGPGLYLLPLVYDLGKPVNPAVIGTLRVDLSNDIRRNHFFGLTGTYYDKDLTDIVYRYDTLYAPTVGVAVADPATRGPQVGKASSVWTEQARFIFAGDRPTYIPWISKQHTFITFQYVNTFYPDLPGHAVNFFGNFAGKLRRDNNFFFIAFTNWLVNGQLTSTNVWSWDVDDTVGFLSSTNVFRYSRNILLGINAQWYLGRSGRYTDPFAFSRDQRISELEASLTYEI